MAKVVEFEDDIEKEAPEKDDDDLDPIDSLLFTRLQCCCVCYGLVGVTFFCILMFGIGYFLVRK